MNEIAPKSSEKALRFRLGSVFVLIAFFALGLTALKFATFGITVATVTLTSVVFLGGLLRLACGPRSARPYWLGFLICGGGYLVLLLVLNMSSPRLPQSAVGPQHQLVNYLVTSEILDFMVRKFNPEIEDLVLKSVPVSVFEYVETVSNWSTYPPLSVASSGSPNYQSPNWSSITDWYGLVERVRNFPRIGHSLFAIIFGVIGGSIAGIMVSRREVASQTT